VSYLQIPLSPINYKKRMKTRNLLASFLLGVLSYSSTFAYVDIPTANADIQPYFFSHWEDNNANPRVAYDTALEAFKSWIAYHNYQDIVGAPYRHSTGANGDWERWAISRVGGSAYSHEEIKRYTCPAGYNPAVYWNSAVTRTYPDTTFWFPATQFHFCAKLVSAPSKPNLRKSNHSPCTPIANPCDAGSGNKHQREVDYRSANQNGIIFERIYNSLTSTPKLSPDFGQRWSHTYQAGLTFLNPSPGIPSIDARRPDGHVITFRYNTSSGQWTAPADAPLQLAPIAAQWRITDEHGRTETYDASGKLIALTGLDGLVTTLAYESGAVPNNKLLSVTDPFGQTMHFGYNNDFQIQTVSQPDGGILQYTYDSKLRLIHVTYPGGAVRQYHYENTTYPYHLTGITDENGVRYATWSYDAQGKVNSSTHAGGASSVSLSVGAGSSTLTDSRNQTRTLQYQLLHGEYKLTNIVGGLCPECGEASPITSYDANGFITATTDYFGNTSKYKHKSNGLKECKVEGFTSSAVPSIASQMRKTTTQWNDSLRLPTSITTWKYLSGNFNSNDACDATSVAWTQVRTESKTYSTGRLIAETTTDFTVNPSISRTTTFTYTTAGLLDVVDGPLSGNADYTDYSYDAQGNVSAITRNTGTLTLTTSFPQYDANGRPLQMIDANGAITNLTYWPRGWLKSRQVDGQTTNFTYDSVGQIDRVTLPTGAYVDYDYDNAHRLIRVTDNLNNKIEYTLDSMGNRTATRTYANTTLKREETASYNALNQLIQSINGVGNTTSYTYNSNGDLARTIDPRDPSPSSPSVFTERSYDALGRVQQIIDALGGTSTSTYDVFDNVASFKDPKNVTTNYTSNGFGENTQESSPDTGLTLFSYDAAGNRQSKTDARGVTITYQYDFLNRPIVINYPTDTDAQFFYDENSSGQNGRGRLTRMIDESGVTLFMYDLRGNILSKTHSSTKGTYGVSYTYDGANNVASVTYPGGLVVAYSRNPAGGIQSVTMTSSGPPQTLATNVSYQPFGPLAALTLGNGLAEQRIYDLAGQLTSISTGALQNESYSYDAAGNISQVSDLVHPSYARTYQYDVLNRLTLDTLSGAPGTVRQYVYDSNGNRTMPGLWPDHSTAYGTEANSNRIDGAAIHDAAGALTYISASGISYGVNGDHVLSDSGRPRLGRKYNGLGERTLSGNSVFLFGEPAQLLAKVDTTSAVPNKFSAYVWLEGRPLALITYTKSGSTFTGLRVQYIHTNGIEWPKFTTSANAVFDSKRTLESSYGIISGQIIPDSNPLPPIEPRLMFPGQFWDITEGRVYYNYFRDYVPSMGRYLEPDPLGLGGGPNRYSYARNNPIVSVDPFGLIVCESWSSCTTLPKVGLFTRQLIPTILIDFIRCTYECPLSGELERDFRFPKGVPQISGGQFFPGPDGENAASFFLSICKRNAPSESADGRQIRWRTGYVENLKPH